MSQFLRLLAIACAVMLVHPLNAQKITDKDFSEIFNQYGVKGCFLLLNEADNEYIRYNSAQCDSGFIPASTFKIPHALIALEEGIIKDTSDVIRWDGKDRSVPSWNQDQTLKTSIKYSCVWVYEGFAKQIPIETYYRYVNVFNYGNKDLTGMPGRFWLQGLLRINAEQQIDFLKKFYHYNLPVKAEYIDQVKDCLILEKKDGYVLSGKNGGAMVSQTDYIMWLVGYLEKGNKVYYYAMNFRTGDYNKTAPARYKITYQILDELGL